MGRSIQAHTQSISSTISLNFCQVGKRSCVKLRDGFLKSLSSLAFLVQIKLFNDRISRNKARDRFNAFHDVAEHINIRKSNLCSLASADSRIYGMYPYRSEVLYDCPGQSGVATLVHRNSDVDDLDDLFDPYRDLLKDVSKLDLFTILVAVHSPAP